MSTKKSSAKPIGHAEHTKPSEFRGLPGKFRRPIKLTMMGAGSGFTPQLVKDLALTPGNMGGTIALVDIDKKRLMTMHQLLEKQIGFLGADNWKFTATTDRTKALPGSDYIVNCIEVSGLDCVRFDNDIPARYGIDQCIGDTIGPGGLFKALRTIPAWLDILADAERYCPEAIVLNYTNPMNMLCLAAGRTSSMQIIGLCHSVQGTSHLLAKRAGVPYEEMVWECAGINHLAWFTKLEHKGNDLYPLLFRKAEQDLAGKLVDKTDLDLVRKDMMLHFGAFITESSGHLSEYVPYYRKRKDLIKKYCRPRYDGESGFYVNNWPRWRAEYDAERLRKLKAKEFVLGERSWEYASWIIEAREKDVPTRIHGNVMNSLAEGEGKLISNLPADGCVEVACMIDDNGINPTRYGYLPPQMAALCDSNMRMFDLGATAAIEKSKEAAILALMLDPLTASVCSPAEIKKMTLEMFHAEKAFLKGYR
ncbi:MAG: alpha-glucosidase/alpha-galactosidase [Methylacidiphilales bacterium]|nr:alpha-glucosidase/alpha-galactosidase [Candidatus Methylacidiphilales bacterium]